MHVDAASVCDTSYSQNTGEQESRKTAVVLEKGELQLRIPRNSTNGLICKFCYRPGKVTERKHRERSAGRTFGE